MAGIANDLPGQRNAASLLTHVRDSRRDTASDLALQAMMTRHRNNHAASALRWRWKSSPRPLVFAKCRNPVFPLTTVLQFRTRGQQDGISQTGLTVGAVFHSALWLSPRRPPSTVVLRSPGAPFLHRGSMASWAPRCNGKPSATSKRFVSGRSWGRRSMVDTLAPGSLHTVQQLTGEHTPHESELDGPAVTGGREAREARGDGDATP